MEWQKASARTVTSTTPASGPVGDTYAGQVEQRPDRRPAGTTTAERTEVPQPEQPGGGGVQPVQVEVGSQPGDHPAVQRVHRGGRLGQPVDVAAPDRGEAGVEAGWSRGQPPDHQVIGQHPVQPPHHGRSVDLGAPVEVEVGHLPPGVHPGVGPAGTDQAGRRVDAQYPAQPGRQLTLDRTLVRLGRPAREGRDRRSRDLTPALPTWAGLRGSASRWTGRALRRHDGRSGRRRAGPP